MITIETAPCPACGALVELVADGRVAYVSTVGNVTAGYADGDTTVVWRNGLVLQTACPARDLDYPDDTCSEIVMFVGEGEGGPAAEDRVSPYFDSVAQPILPSMP